MNPCPWNWLEPATLSFCEASQCGWISQPANSFSSLSYVVLGMFIWLQPRRESFLRCFGVLACLIGVTSFFYHASNSFLGEFLDIGSMYLFSALILTLNLIRIGILSKNNWGKFYFPLVLGSLFLLLNFKKIGIWMFGVQVVLFIGLEIYLFFKRKSNGLGKIYYKNYLMALGFFSASYIIWLLDFHKVVCSPQNHFFQGHAVWHFLNAFCFYFLYRFYLQFDWNNPREFELSLVVEESA